jgi:hypothetical protein
MVKPIAWLGQVLLYGLFALIVGLFSSWPPYHPLQEGQALIKLSFSHHGQRASECRQRTAEELAKLPPNMRAPMDCKRERSPVTVEIDIDDAPAYRHVAIPSGLSEDGASTVYQRFPVTAGEHRIAVRLKDDMHAPGFNYQREETVSLFAGKVLVIDFNAEKGGITFQ